MRVTIDIPDRAAAIAAGQGVTPETLATKVVHEFVLREARVSQPKKMDLDTFFEGMAQFSDRIPVLPDNAMTREAIYDDHS